MAMERALENAGLDAAAIGYINAHGTGTEANDRAETRAVRRLFGDGAMPPMSSCKPVFGHCLGAAGMIELVGSIASGAKGVLPPTPNFAGAREGCAFDAVAETGRAWPDKPFLKNNFAFGGNNAGIVVTLGAQRKVVVEEELKNTPEIWITSLGIVSIAGVGSRDFSNVVHRNAEGPPVHVADDALLLSWFDPRNVDRRLDARGLDRASQFSASAAWLCLAEAEHITSLYVNEFHLNQLTAFPYIVPNSVTGNVCRALGLNGPNATFCLGPGAGLLGLGPVIASLKAGHSSIALTGAADEISAANREELLVARKSNAGASRIPAEGSVMFLLETADHAHSRGAGPIGRIAGFCQTTDIEDPCLPDAGYATALQAITTAIDRAAISAEAISMVCCNPSNPREAAVLDITVPLWRERLVGVPARFGGGETTAQLLDLSMALLAESIEKRGSTYYILSLLCSPNGYNAACIIEAGF
jgi:3-oxoacyl-[acyl-carrier-protein] synthase II